MKPCFTAALLCLALGAIFAGPLPAQAQQSTAASSQTAEEFDTCSGDPAAGAPLFETCAVCHSLTADADPLDGPHLEGLFGRRAGSVSGFPYSSSLQSSDVVWNISTLRSFLTGKMDVPGHPVVLDFETRGDLMTFVRLESRSPPPLPEDVMAPHRVLEMEGDVAYGEYLASDCLSCHNAAAVSTGTIPALLGQDAEFIITQLYRYRLRALPNEVMQVQATRLSEEEIAALAAYLSTATP